MSDPLEPRLRLAFYGKGGVGKSTIASHVCAALHEAGRRVLLLGCDPKQDVSSRLGGDVRGRTLADHLAAGRSARFEELRVEVRPGLDLVEAGGSEPGTGCAGRGVANLCDVLEREAILDSGYDATCFDVLGDLVCGGFVAPLRKGFVETVCIVSSEEIASLFVVNNVARVVLQPYNRRVRRCAVVFNLKQPDAPIDQLRRFAARVGIECLAFIHRDPLVLEAEGRRTTVLDHCPEAPIADELRRLAARIAAPPEGEPTAPTPLSLDAFWDWIRESMC